VQRSQRRRRHATSPHHRRSVVRRRHRDAHATCRTCMGRVPPPPVVVQVSPTPVLAGSSVTLSGSVGPEAAGSDCSKIILYSDAFAPTNRVGDMTAVYATATPSDAFSATTTIPRSKLAGSYTIYLRWDGATLGGGTLVVRAAPTTPAANVAVSPRSVVAGGTVTLSGSVGRPESVAGSECAPGVKLLRAVQLLDRSTRRPAARTRAGCRRAARNGPAAAGSPPATPATARPHRGGGQACRAARHRGGRFAG
jgi:hypothetical protein